MAIIQKHLEVFGSTIEPFIKPFIKNNGVIIDVSDDPDSALSKSKQKITVQAGNDGTKNVEIMVPLKCVSNLWRTLEMPLIVKLLFFNLVWRMYYSN